MKRFVLLALTIALASCAGKHYETEVPISNVPTGWKQRGLASWYGPKFHGRKTASGERFNMYSLTAAHKTLPLGTYVKVKNLKNGRAVVVKINDRGPFVRGRIIDLSYAAAKKLGMIKDGVVPVEITVIGKPQEVVDRYSLYNFGYYYVQIGSFKDWFNAIRLAQKVKTTGFPVEIRPVDIEGERFYRVLVGPYTRVGAQRVAYRLKREGYNAKIQKD
ncbi:rare lipoprotein A [Thermosulfidibacter takaii ABI70S6]|uniref:Probable endolytic peptidoglycan transglycosylase RlpA n=1 Tax=Thermosulfidibacter takaii (strain DSM 17441 / JCM 13301 / NBRC 103674 / ABI70S6) TaxID=1298851 RepID=A0A0S3QUY5_THET7|nr:septal ring lytic transglycosylase RlpA family protein [Thermosulfidibacter takaii]BAT72127.1 rare lipoprotein A [Thermosulfidibacter takaii ABI70S6]